MSEHQQRDRPREPRPNRTSAVVSLWIGTYPEAGLGTPAGVGEGVWHLTLDLGARRFGAPHLAATAPAPSFLALHPDRPMLYALGETSPGTVTAFGIQGDALEQSDAVPSGGDGPCHLMVGPGARALYVSHYADGLITVVPLDSAGKLADGSAAPAIRDPSQPTTARLGRSHAHFAAVAPGGKHMLVCDLGTDELRRYRVERNGGLVEDGVAATLPSGTGPRHLAVGPDGLLHVTGELDGRLHVLRWDPGTATAVPVGVTPLGLGTLGYPAHAERDGARVHVSVRGSDILSTFAIDEVGQLRHLGQVSTGGKWPRHFAVVGDVRVVANEHSHEVAAIGPDGEVIDVAVIPSPACVVVDRSRR